jgi:hypothetical protein
MAFVAAMNNAPATGVNGSAVLTEEQVGDPRVVLFTSAIRDCEADFIERQLDLIGPTEDAWLIAFQTRDVRGGKGEREVFYKMINYLLSKSDIGLSLRMLALVPEYGCWIDLIHIMEHAPTFIIKNAIIQMIKDQLVKDEAAMAAKKSVSLLAKWLPREQKAHANLIPEFANIGFNDTKQTKNWKLMQYRKRVSALNKYLKTTEINMCGGTWAQIEPSAVPGRCLNINRTAFFNQKLKQPNKSRTASADRIKCADNFKTFMFQVRTGEKKINGAETVFPHQITKKIALDCSEEQEALLEEQWNAIREKTAAAGGLTKTVVISDVSGSMEGTPMDISIALGILISEINDSEFKDHVMTFHTTPSWVSLASCKSLKEKVERMQAAPWGGSTNFEASMDLILDRLVAASVRVEDQPDDILVLTDMGFDEASHGSAFHIDEIRRKWSAAGYKVPRIIIWNLRAQYKEYHASAQQSAVLTLSGWSPALLKTLSSDKKNIDNSVEVLRALLDDSRYDPVRAAFRG